jgi:dTMP kinase
MSSAWPIDIPQPQVEKRARLIVFQGIDGAGKTTQAKALSAWLSTFHAPVFDFIGVNFSWLRALLDQVARENGCEDHVALLGPDTARVAIGLLVLRDLVERLGPMLLTEGAYVVADRYSYGHYVLARRFRASNEALLRRLFSVLPEPDLTIFLSITPRAAKRRLAGRGVDDESLSHLEQLDRLCRELPEFESFAVIDAEQQADAVRQDIRSLVRACFRELQA